MTAWSVNLESIWETKRKDLSQCTHAQKNQKKPSLGSSWRSLRKKPYWTVACFVFSKLNGRRALFPGSPWSQWRKWQWRKLINTKLRRRLSWIAKSVLGRRIWTSEVDPSVLGAMGKCSKIWFACWLARLDYAVCEWKRNWHGAAMVGHGCGQGLWKQMITGNEKCIVSGKIVNYISKSSTNV